jgi:hypothetical protein
MNTEQDEPRTKSPAHPAVQLAKKLTDFKRM